MSEATILGRLLVSTVLAGAVGFERERHGRAAGFRTHVLVGVGACLIMLTGLYLQETLDGTTPVDPTRMAAQVVSGIGFLGAGTMLRFRASVRGLTTAASLWAIGGVGLAVGAGLYWGAIGATVLVITMLFGFSHIERAMRRDVYRTLVVDTRASGEALQRLREVLGEYEVEIRDFNVTSAEQPGISRLQLDVKLLTDRNLEEILGRISGLEETMRVHWV